MNHLLHSGTSFKNFDIVNSFELCYITITWKGKVKVTAALEGGEWSAARPGRTLPPEKIRYPFYRRLDGPQGRSGRAENLVPTGIRFRTVQPVAQSLCVTDLVILVALFILMPLILNISTFGHL